MAPKAAAKAAAAAPKAEPKAKAEPKKVKKEKEEKDPADLIEKVPQPDPDAFKEKVAKVNEDIEKLQKKQAALAEKIKERSGGKEGFFAEKQALRNQLDEYSGKMNELQAKKEEINKQVGDKRQEGRDMKTQLTKMKKSIGYSSEAEIDERIATIKFKMMTDSVSLKDEKKFLQEIQELTRSKPKVSQLHKMEDNLQNFDAGSIKENMGAINEEMAKYRELKRGVSAKLSELMESRKEQLGDLPQIIEQRDGIGKEIAEKIQERNAIRDENRQAEKAYWAYQGELRKIRQEKQMEERQKRQAEFDLRRKERAAEKLDEQPYVAEIVLIEQTMLFCRSLTQSKDTDQKEEKKEIAHNNPEGTEILIKKEDRDEEYFFAPTAKGKKGKNKGQGAKSEGSSTKKTSIKHNAETFRLFDQLKLDAPITTDDIPALLVKLEEQLEMYNQKVKTWEEKRDEMKRKILEEGIMPEDEEKKEEEAKEGDKEEEKKEEAKEEA